MLKAEIVQKCFAGHTSYPRLVKECQIPNASVIYQWVFRYTSGKLLNTTTVKDGRKTTKLERIEIAQWVITNVMDYKGATHNLTCLMGKSMIGSRC